MLGRLSPLSITSGARVPLQLSTTGDRRLLMRFVLGLFSPFLLGLLAGCGNSSGSMDLTTPTDLGRGYQGDFASIDLAVSGDLLVSNDGTGGPDFARSEDLSAAIE